MKSSWRPVRSRRAMALMMVVMILAILVVIGTPFAVSMLLQEKSGRSFLEDTRARFAVEGARNHAIASLWRSHDWLERQKGAIAPFNNPFADGVDQLSVELSDLASEGFPIADPRGAIWGAEVEDEQAKLNRRTVPGRVLEALYDYLGQSGGPKWHFVTEFSQRPAQWVGAQAVRSLTLDQNGLTIVVDYGAVLLVNPDRRLRLTKGQQQLVGTAAELQDLLGTRIQDFQPPGTILEMESIHPVNPNVASREVLAAIFKGLALRTLSQAQIDKMVKNSEAVPPQHFVDKDEAMALAVKIVQRDKPFDTPRSFFDFIHDEVQNGDIPATDGAAIYVNSINPYDGRLFTNGDGANWLGTVPFCYDSNNVYLVDATGVANNSAANEAGKRVVRDIVEVAPPQKLTWAIESQFDFDRQMWRGQGNRMVSWPARSFAGGDPTAVQLPGDQAIPMLGVGEPPSLDRTPDVGYLTQRAPPDRRNPGNMRYRNSWDANHEGLQMAGPLTFDPKQIGMVPPPRGTFDMNAGGVEFWVKFPTHNPDTCFFDVAAKPRENRLRLEYDASKEELVLMACDATVDKVASEVRAQVTFEPNTWYHIGAIWKSTKYAQLCLLVDGFPKGTFQLVDQNGKNSVTTLTAALDETATTVAVKSTKGYPPVGVIEVGDEAIEYTGASGTSFTGCTRGARKTGSALQRTAQGDPQPFNPKEHTHTHTHPAGAAVCPFGYANLLQKVGLSVAGQNLGLNGIPAVKGTLVSDFGPKPQAQTGPKGLGPSDTTIMVVSNANPPAPDATKDFPQPGYLLIAGTEIVYYKTKGNNIFSGCQRGQFGTAPVTVKPPPLGRPVPIVMWGFPVTDVSGYPNPSIIQIGDEWMVAHPEPAGVGGPFMTGITFGQVHIPPLRNFLIGPAAAHKAKDKVIPVFATKDPSCGAQDMVTIVTQNQTGRKEQMKVRHGTYLPTSPTSGVGLAAFDDFQAGTYTADGVTRLLKFPSGELASLVPNPVDFGAESAGGGNGGGRKLAGMVDDLRIFASPRGDFRTDAAAGVGDKQIQVNQVSSMATDLGAIKLGDELVGWIGSSGGGPFTLGNAKRGYLKSTPQAHGTGERFLNMSFMVLTATTAAADDRASSIPVKRVNGFAPVGFALVDDEVIGYHDTSSGTALAMPVNRKGDGMFRGAFGTTPAAHDVAALVYGMPFRYFDFSRTEAFDNQMNYFQASLHATGAKFLSLRWAEERRMAKASLRVLARVDGKPAWDETPTNRPGGIYEFTEPDGRNALDVSGNELQVQVRFEYRGGSYVPDNSWKYSPKLKGLWVNYVQPEVVHSHEEE